MGSTVLGQRIRSKTFFEFVFFFFQSSYRLEGTGKILVAGAGVGWGSAVAFLKKENVCVEGMSPRFAPRGWKDLYGLG